MEYTSYKLLQEFEQELIAQGFDDIPLEHTERDIAPFGRLFSEWSGRFSKSLVDDLRQALGENLEVKVLSQSFIPVDDHAQGATYIYTKVDCSKGEDVIQLRVRYVVFYGRVLILSRHNQDKVKDKTLTKKLAKLNDQHKEPYEQFIELREL